ncbi:hypothetical protein GYH30_036267 [Glycine max]|nr:hypothetical protein JHK86_036512 [Glycine max]KAH1101618.1 hypothetical protein GYH30_036267 [Glycine max]
MNFAGEGEGKVKNRALVGSDSDVVESDQGRGGRGRARRVDDDNGCNNRNLYVCALI